MEKLFQCMVDRASREATGRTPLEVEDVGNGTQIEEYDIVPCVV